MVGHFALKVENIKAYGHIFMREENINTIMIKSSRVPVTQFKLRAVYIVDHLTLPGTGIADANQCWSFCLKLGVYSFQVEGALNYFVFFYELLQVRYTLIILDEHDWVDRIIDILLHQLLLDVRAALVGQVERHFG